MCATERKNLRSYDVMQLVVSLGCMPSNATLFIEVTIEQLFLDLS
jgi:hypothetical protein